MNMNANITAGTIIRTVTLGLALVNHFLVMAGHSPLPIEDAQVETILSELFLIVTAVAAWWKNNSFTKPALIADSLMHGLKSGATTVEAIEEAEA